MAELTVDITYGQALYSAAADLDKTEEMLAEGKELVKIIGDIPEFKEFLSTPIIAAGKKKESIRKIFEGKVSQEMLNFMYVLIDKSRAGHFERIIKQFEKLIDENKGFSLGTIFSIKPLSDGQLESFEKETGKLLRKQIRLENKVDKNLIGGVRIFIEGKVIDASIQRKLMNLRENLN